MELFVLLVLCLCAAAAIFAIAKLVLILVQLARGQAPFIPARRALVHALPEVCKLPHGSVWYDLGSGDGRVAIAMARAYPHSSIVGIESAFYPYLLSRLRALTYGTRNVRFIRADFNHTHLHDATHVYLYLLPATMNALLPKLQNELKSGVPVLSCEFRFSTIEPEETYAAGNGLLGHTVYKYRIS